MKNSIIIILLILLTGCISFQDYCEEGTCVKKASYVGHGDPSITEMTVLEGCDKDSDTPKNCKEYRRYHAGGDGLFLRLIDAGGLVGMGALINGSGNSASASSQSLAISNPMPGMD